MMKKPMLMSLAMLTLLTIFLAACGAQAVSTETGLSSETEVVSVAGAGAYTDVSAEGLALLLADKSFPLINVHIPYAGEIEGTDAFIPFDAIDQNLDSLPADKDARLVIYCRSGSMSAEAAQTLVALGYTDVWNVAGGMVDWQNAGRPLLNR